MTSLIRRSYGNKNFRGYELQNFKLHTYGTLASMNADVATAAGRLVYSAQDTKFYLGTPGTWTAVGAGGGGSGVNVYADYASLPGGATAGTVAVALDNGAGRPALYIFDSGDNLWHLIADELIVLSDGSVHFTAIPAVSNAGILPTQPPHLTTKVYVDTALTAATAAHNVDPLAHPLGTAGPANGGHALGGADGAFSKSGQNVLETAFVVNGSHGSPLTDDPFFGVYKLCPTTKKPVGLLWKASTKTTPLGSASVGFDNASSKITVTDNSVFVVGDLVGFPSSVSNLNKYYTITGFEVGTRLIVTPAPVSETVTSAVDRYKPDGIVVFEGRFVIDLSSTVASAIAVTGITVATGRVKLAAFAASYNVRKGDTIVLAGTATNDGSYTVSSYDRSTLEVVLTAPLGGSDAGAAGTATITHTGQANNFKASYADGDPATAFYLDVSDSKYYTQNAYNFLLGYQVSVTEFIIGIEQVNKYRYPTQTSSPTLVRELYQLIPIDTTGGAFGTNLVAGVNGDIVEFIDVGNFCSTNGSLITPFAGNTIAGQPTWVIDFNGMPLRLRFWGTQWEVL